MMQVITKLRFPLVRIRWSICAALLIVGLLLLLFPDLLWARAGGGGSYGGGSSGGGGGGSSGGGGGGGGEIIYLLIWLCMHHPLIGYPLVLGLIALAVLGGNSTQQAHVTRTIRRGLRHQEDRLRDEAIARIQRTDPDFDLSEFLERMGRAFTKIQLAWSEQNLSPVRGFISDGIHERFSLQLGMQRSEGIRNVMENVQIHHLEAVALFTHGNYQSIHVRVEASAVDYDADLKTGRRKGAKSSERFVEYWSFHRRVGAKSIKARGAIEGNCPRCGAELKIVDKTDCTSCGAHVNSGEFDWVLAEITQEQEWNIPGHEQELPGVAELCERDPGFSIQHIEDRVSVAFWRLRATEFYQDMNYATPILSPRYAEEFAAKMHPARFWKNPAVGKVEVLEVQPGERSRPDKIRVKVRWSGMLLEKQSRNRVQVVRTQAIYTHVFVLQRDYNARSIPDATFSSAGCHSCGAPIHVNRQGDCIYCGTSLNSGRHDWVLENVLPFTPAQAFEVRRGPQRTAQDSGLTWAGSVEDVHADSALCLSVLARVMLIDGKLAPQEREALQRIGKHRGYTAEQVTNFIEQARTREAIVPTPQNSRQAGLFLEQLVHVALADGQITRSEKKLLTRFAEKTGMSEADVKLAINRERKRSYQAARRELRSGRSLSS